MQNDNKTSKGKFTLYQRIFRLVLFVVIVFTFVYITIPFWLPASFVRNAVVSDLENQLGVPVTAGEVDVSWADGVIIRDLCINNAEGFSEGSIVDVPEIRAHFSPWHFLVQRKIKWMRIVGAKLAIQVNEQGHANTKIFDRLKSDVQTLHTMISKATVTIDLPKAERLLVLDVADVQYQTGRLAGLGRLTLSAVLKQLEQPAAISVNMDPGIEQNILAAASFNFTGLDLEQLGLVKLLGLQVRKLAGNCNGSLDLKFDRASSKVGYFTCDFNIDSLEVQPLDENVEIDIIEQAGVRIAANYDPYDPAGERVDIKSLSIRLPGLDMAGGGTVYSEILQGKFQAVRQLNLEGKIVPSVLDGVLDTALIDKEQINIDGPLNLTLDINQKGTKVFVLCKTDASKAVLKKADQILKQSNVPLVMRSRSVFDQRDSSLEILESEITFAENSFNGAGYVGDVRKLLDDKSEKSNIAQLLKPLKWRGEMQISDFASLRNFCSPLGIDLSKVELTGNLKGLIDLDCDRDIDLFASLKAPKDSVVLVKEVFEKPSGKMMESYFRGKFASDSKQLSMDNVEMGLVVDDTGFIADNTKLAFDSDVVVLDGEFQFKKTEKFFGYFKDVQTERFSGTTSGKYYLQLSSQAQRMRFQADMKTADLRVDEFFIKPLGESATLEFDFTRDMQLSSDRRNVGRFVWGCPSGKISADVLFDEQGDDVQVSFVGDLQDATWIKKSLPFMAKDFATCELAGSLNINGDIQFKKEKVRTNIRLNADQLEIIQTDNKTIFKPAGLESKLRFAGELLQREPNKFSAEIDTLEIDLADNHVNITGRADITADGYKDTFGVVRPHGVSGLELTYQAVMKPDKRLANLSPQLKKIYDENHFDGTVLVSGRIDSDENGVNITADINGDKLECDLADGFKKSSDMPMNFVARMDVPASLDRIRIRDARGVCDNIRITAGGTVFINGSPERWPSKATASQMHVSAESEDMSILSKMIDGLKKHELNGSFLADVEWDSRKSDKIEYVTFNSDSIKGNYNGREVEVIGDLTLRGISKDADGKFTLDGFKADTFSVRAGEDQFWVVGEVESLGKAPKGKVDIIANNVYSVGLSYWLEGKPYDENTKPESTEYNEKELLESARATAKQICECFGEADLAVNFKAGFLRNWDQSVGYFYDTRMMYIYALIQDGKIDMKYGGGVSGGSLRGGLEIPVNDVNGQVKFWKVLKDAYATDAIRAQMYKYFPGNEVKEFFNRDEEGSADLVTFIANSMDSRYKLRHDGRSKTVAIKGETAGRAAPKYITKLFPGLNFTHYYYRKMTSFSREYADGRAESDMVFDGELYDVYIEGTTDVNNIARYQVGLILLGTPQTAEWNHEWKQGRLPLFNVRAIIKDGKFEDMKISYPWPNQSLGTIFIKNNILYRAWLNSRDNPAE